MASPATRPAASAAVPTARSSPAPRRAGRGREATDPIGHAFLVTDATGRVRSWSRGAEALYGWTAEEALGRRVGDLIGGGHPRMFQAMHRMVAQRGAWTGTLWPIARDGTPCRVEIHAVSLPDAPGAPSGVMAAHIDLRRREQARAAEGQAHFQAALLERIESIMVAADARDRVIYWNDAAAKAYGYSSRQALGRHIDRLLPAADLPERRRLRRRLRAGAVVRIDAPVSGRDGRALVVNSVSAPMHDADGTYQGWISVGHDVTAQRLADARLAAVVESAPFAVVLIDADLTMLYANAATAAIAGRARDELRGGDWIGAVHPDDREPTRRTVEAALREGRAARMTGRAQLPDGSIRHFAYEVIPFELAGAVAGCAVIAFAIPDAGSGSLPETTRARILDEISNAVVVTGLDGIVRYWNAAAERRFGWPADEIIGRRTADLGVVVDEETVAAMTDALMREGRWVGEVRHRRRDGSLGDAYVTTNLVLDADGRPESIVSVSADMDSIRDRQAALELQSQIVAGIDAGMWLLDPVSGRIAFVNPGYERLMGLRLEDLHADRWAWLARVHPDDRERVRAAVEVDPLGVDIECRIEATPGDASAWRHVHALTVAIPDGAGGVRWVAGMFSDITSLRDAESRLEQMGTAIDESRDGILLVDAEWRAIYVNRSFETLTGHARDAIIGRQPLEVIGGAREPLSPMTDIIAAALRGDPWSGPVDSVRGDGRPLRVDLSVWPIADAHGNTSSIVVMFRERGADDELRDVVERQARLQAAIGGAMSRLDAAATTSEAADAVIGPALELDGVDVATIMAFTNGSLVVPLAARGPRGMPIEARTPMPSPRSAWLRRVSHDAPAVRDWRPRKIDGVYGRRWTDLGLTAVAYIPLVVDGDVVGLLTAGSTSREGRAILTRQLPALTEYGAMASALLGRRLRELRERHDRLGSLSRVIEERAFHPVFQPIVELGSRAVVGYEALTRFADGAPPDQRFAEAEELGLSTALETATVRAACEAARKLPAGPWVSLNVTPTFLDRASVLRRLVRSARRPVVLEITERTPVEDYDRLRRRVASIGGVRLAVDDAGAGFASLRHIIELRPDIVKLDVGLVRGIGSDRARQALVAGMVHFAAESGCALIAEGIETETELRALRRLGVALGQGYLLGRPIEAPAA